MKAKAILTAIFITVLITTVTAQSKLVKQIHQLAPFTAIVASSGWDIIISQDNKQTFSTEVSESVVDRMLVEVKNGTLTLSMKKGLSMNVKNTVQKAYITVADLKQITASGGTDFYFKTPIRTTNFKLTMSGGSDVNNLALTCKQFDGSFSGGSDANIKLTRAESIAIQASGGSDVNADIEAAQTLIVRASGGSDIDLKGDTKQFNLTASGGSDISASTLTAQHCQASFSGAADGSIRVTGMLDVEVTGSADVTCYGNPKEVKKNISRTGSFKLK